MAQLTINTGSTPNDKSADSLYSAFNKVNSNFADLYQKIVAITVTQEMMQDTTASMFVNGAHSGITVSYDDAGSTINLVVDSSANRLTGTIPDTVLENSTVYIGTTPILLNRKTGTINLTGVNVDGYASALKNSATTVNVSNSPAPSAGHVLTALSDTIAEWRTLPDINLVSVSGVLPVSNGGTGVTVSTGSNKVVLSTNPTITSAITTDSETFDLINSTATTINFAGAANNLRISSGSGTTTINNNLQVAGDITFGGSTTQLSATQLQVSDTMIYMAANNVADIFDIGILGTYNTNKYSGLVRDASDTTWKLFKELTVTPTATVDFTYSSFADIRVGVLTANQLVSSVATGTAPLLVTSATPVAGLNIGGYSAGLKTSTGSVSVSSSTAPTTGQVLTAVSDTVAIWKTPNAGGIRSGDTPPVNPVSDQLWFDTIGGRLFVYYSGTWIDTNPESNRNVGSTTTMRDTPPTSPNPGDMWFDTVGGRLYIRYSNAWVDTNPNPN